MDITQRFKAAVMTVKVQHKSDQQPPDKNRILSKSSTIKPSAHHARDEFSKQAKDVRNKITALRDLLLENRTAYMRIGQHLKSATHITDEQRDLIDRESEKIVIYYTQHLAQMRSEWKRTKRKPQQQIHIDAVLNLLENYLHSVEKIYLAQKKYRLQHELETYRLLKLASDKRKIPVRPAGEQSGKRSKRTNCLESNESLNRVDDLMATAGQDELELEGDWNTEDADMSWLTKNEYRNTQEALNSTSNSMNDSKLQAKTSQVALDEDLQKSQEAEAAASKLSPEDIQMFEQENVQLYHELQGLAEEVELIEKNVVDIAQLQDIFTEKVSMQQHNIERIANAVIGATENVKDANEQIKQAIKRNAGLRVWSLFFLLVMSFTLLFLDWYYD